MATRGGAWRCEVGGGEAAAEGAAARRRGAAGWRDEAGWRGGGWQGGEARWGGEVIFYFVYQYECHTCICFCERFSDDIVIIS